MLLGTASVVHNAYEGFGKVHGIELSEAGRTGITLLFVITAIIIYALWTRQSGARDPRFVKLSEALLPGWAMPAVLGIIIVAGYLVSTPKNITSNSILLTIYTICILTSAGLFGVLEYRRRM